MVVEYIASVDAWFVVGFVVVLEQILGFAYNSSILNLTYQSMGVKNMRLKMYLCFLL